LHSFCQKLSAQAELSVKQTVRLAQPLRGCLGEQNPTGWSQTIQLGEFNCREPEALPHQSNTPHAHYQKQQQWAAVLQCSWQPLHARGDGQPLAQPHQPTEIRMQRAVHH
jgi:hypothetical protein